MKIMENNSSIKITYESLFELLRNEKNKEELQKLDENFFKNISQYLNEKNAMLDKPDDNIFVKTEKQKTLQQIANIKKIIKDICQRREKKIINMALLKSRIEANVDVSNLLNEEKIIFSRLVDFFDEVKNTILNKILDGAAPDIDALKQKQAEMIPASAEQHKEKDEAKESGEEMRNLAVRFTQYVPSFMGTDLNSYGPFEPEDIACLPEKMANLIILKKAGEGISIK